MINFPTKKTVSSNVLNNDNVKKTSSISNRGMSFEKKINESCEYFRTHGLAVIHKKPTPVRIVKVDYPQRSRAKIIEAYYQVASTTDYNGIYKEKYIDFEAKETSRENYLSFDYIHEHQVKHLIDIVKHGGIGFLLIYFKKRDEVYLYDLEDFLALWTIRKEADARKSIPYEDIKEKGTLVKQGFLPQLEILKAIDEKYFK